MNKLICPICKTELMHKEKIFYCVNNHSFDQAKSGYINLLVGKKPTGDNAMMAKARADFLEKDYYHVLRDYLKEFTKDYACTLDLACGEGYYTRSFSSKEVYGFDLSKEAILYASKKDKSAHYGIASIFDLPIQSNSMDLVTELFAPVPAQEVVRVLKKEGIFLLVSPGPYHLFELKQAIYDTPYLNEYLKVELPLTPYKTLTLKDKVHITSNEEIEALFKMTPYYYKTSKKDQDKLHAINELDVTVEFYVQLFKKD